MRQWPRGIALKLKALRPGAEGVAAEALLAAGESKGRALPAAAVGATAVRAAGALEGADAAESAEDGASTLASLPDE